MRIKALLFASLLFLSFGVAGCHPKVPNTPEVVETNNPSVAIDAAVYAAKLGNYRIEALDASRGYLRIRAKLDQGAYKSDGDTVRPMASWFSVSVDRNGFMIIEADGYHVVRDKMHPKLSDERAFYAARVRELTTHIATHGRPPGLYDVVVAPPEAPPPPVPERRRAPPMPPSPQTFMH